jgi:N-acetylglucosaminyl-diphospho-decaprenol L-rhamnosyltransferase
VTVRSTVRPEVTAVVVTHNSARHLAALGRALAGGSLAPARMLVVDNLSGDDTVEHARAAGFGVLETGANDGFGAGCNAGLRATRTELVLFCNPDVRPSPMALEQLSDALANDPAAAVAGAVLGEEVRPRGFSTISRNVAGFLPQRLQELARTLKPKAPAGPSDAGATNAGPSDGALVVDYAEGAFLLCRVAPLRSVAGFDERFFLYCEEEDLSRRLSERGWRTLLVACARVSHEQRGSSDGFGAAAMAPFFTHSLYWYYRRYHSRAYAELARVVLAACVAIDRGCRAIARRPQMYGRGAAIAPFRSAESVRRAQQRLAGRRDR